MTETSAQGPTDGTSEGTSEGADRSGTGQGAGARRKPRWLRRLVIGMVLALLLLVIAGPPLASGFIRRQIEVRGSEFIDGAVTLDELTLSANGKARLEGLTVTDANGDVVVHLSSVKLDLGLRSLIRGRADVALLIEGAEIEIVRDAEGLWNFEELLGPDDTDVDDEPGGSEPLPREPLDIHGRLEIVDSTIIVRSPDTSLELRDLHFTIGLDGPDQETAVRFDATLMGKKGSAGVFHADVFVWPDAGPGLRIDDVSARDVDLAIVAEALLLVGSPLEEGSTLSGTADLVMRGRLADLDPETAFTLEVDGSVHALDITMVGEGSDPFTFQEDEATLEVRASGDGGGVEPRATARLNGRDGRVAAEIAWDGAAETGLVVALDIDALEASAGLTPYLARVHPAFASASAFKGANLGGVVSSRLEFRYDAPLPLASFAAGADDTSTDEWLSTEKWSGTGSLTVDEGLVQTSELFGKLLEVFGEPANPSFSLKPLGFAVDAGRITYTQPWSWTIQGTETQFVGSVGLDRSLDLNWVVPVTGALAEQNSVFEAVAGETFEVGVGGTLSSPKFDVAGALSTLAQNVGKQKFQDLLEKEVGSDAGMDAIRGILEGELGTVDDAAKRLIGASGNPDKLFKEANRLWDEGKKDDAAKIYRRIRKEFPFSPTYLLNKSKIKGRRNG